MSRAEDAGQQVLSLLHERGLLPPRPLLQASGKWGCSVASVCQPCAAHGRGHTVHPWAGLLGRKCQGLPTAPVPPRGGCCQPVPAQVPHISQFTKLNCVCEHFVDGTNRQTLCTAVSSSPKVLWPGEDPAVCFFQKAVVTA